MSNFHLIVPLLLAGSMTPAAQDPATQDAPAVAPADPIADVEPQSALRGVLLLRGLFEEFARKDGGLALGGAFAAGTRIPFSGPELFVSEMTAVFQAGEAGKDKKAGIRLGLELEIRAGDVPAAIRRYERLRAFLSGSEAIVSLGTVPIEELDDGGGVRIPGFVVLVDASEVEIERWTSGPGAESLAPEHWIRACAVRDSIELGGLNMVVSMNALPSGHSMLSYSIVSSRRARSFDVRRLGWFANAIETRSPDLFVTRWRLAPAVDEETGIHGWGLDLTVSRIE